MAKQKAVVDREKLQAAINKAEASGPLTGRSELWKAATIFYNSDNPPVQITPSVTYLRFVEMELKCQTPVGRKGTGKMTDEQKAKMKAARASGGRRSRASKLAALPGAAEHFKRLRDNVPSRYQGLVDRLEKGSLTAAIKLQCVQCMGYEAKQVWDCRGYICPLYLHRPYQKAEDAEKEGTGETEPAQESEK